MGAFKYTLPRHTNLAKQGSRIAAFLIDLASFLAVTIAFYAGCFNLIFKSETKPRVDAIHQEEVNSHLRYKDEKGNMKQIASDASFEEYKDILTYYFFNFVKKEGIPEEIACKESLDVKLHIGGAYFNKEDINEAWFNQYMLGIDPLTDPKDQKDCEFTYVLDDQGNYDKTKIGIPKQDNSISSKAVNTRMQNAYKYAYQSFVNMKYYDQMNNEVSFIYTCELVASSLIALALVYVLVPFILKDGQTFGKKLYKLGLANSDGYKFEEKQLFMRAMPAAVMILALLIPIWTELAVLLIVYVTVFLVSFALAMASPKRASLHDFTARSIVIDKLTSIIFIGPSEEEEYLLKEDNNELEVIEATGEEPEISYER